MSAFFEHITPIYLLYLLYGTVFLFLGVSIVAKDMRGSDLQLAESLWLLGIFGFLHGAHEWLELGPLIEGEHLLFPQILLLKTISTVVVILSFLFLLQFGLSLLRIVSPLTARGSMLIFGALLLLWALYVRQGGLSLTMHSLYQADTGGRYAFGFTGALLTAYGLIRYSRKVSVLSRPVSRRLSLAGAGFIFYGLSAGLFISNSQIPGFPVPIQLLRGSSALFITYFIIRGLNIFDIETRNKIELHMRNIAQAEKLKSLGQLAAGIAHEINNPLTNASLGIQTLRRKLSGEKDAKEIVDRIDAVERNIDRASSIARELLHLSRQEESRFVAVDIRDVIRTSLTLMEHKLGPVVVKQDHEAVPEIMGDPGKLEQVFINVLSNSIEAMPGGGMIAISTRHKHHGIVIRITDSGIGIPAKKMSRIFDPFFTTKEIGRGTGLGLSISYGIIRQHGGSMELESAAGAGTTVTITLPARGGT